MNFIVVCFFNFFYLFNFFITIGDTKLEANVYCF